MATGDYSNITLNDRGDRLAFTLEGMTASGITAVESGKTINLNATRQVAATVGSDVTEEVPLEFLSSSVNAGTSEFLDNFTGTGGTLLPSHTPDNDDYSSGWTNQRGAWDIASAGTLNGTGAAVDTIGSSITGDSNSNNIRNIATVDTGDADPDITCTVFEPGSSRGAGIVARYSADNWIEVLVDDGGGDEVRIGKVVSGAYTELGTYALGFSPRNIDTEIRLVCSGSNLEVFVNGTSRISVTDSHNSTVDLHGIVSNGGASAFGSIRSFQINPGIASADITMGVTRPIHQNDVSITLDADVGAFNDGSNDSAALSGQAVTNSSTLAYFQPCGGIIGIIESGGDKILVNNSVVSGTITVQAQFDHPRGVDRVVFSADDGVNSPVTATATARTQSSYIDDKLSDTGRFYFQGSLDLSGLDDGSITITATAYPTIGDGNEYAPTWTVYNNSGSTVATAMSGGIGWSWNGSFGGTVGTPPVVYVNSSTGNDSTGNGTSGSPYATVHKAINELVTANCESWAEIRIMDSGPHTVDQSSTADFDAWIRVTGDSSLTGSSKPTIQYDSGHTEYPNVSFARGASARGTMFENCIIAWDTGRVNSNVWFAKDTDVIDRHGAWHLSIEWSNYTDSTKTLSGGIGEYSVAGIANAQSRSLAKSDKIYITGESATGSVVAGEYTIASIDEINDTVTLTTSITGGTGDATDVVMGHRNLVQTGTNVALWATDCNFLDVPSGPSTALLVRNTNTNWCGGDWVQETYLIVANKIRNFKGAWSGSGGLIGFHSDIIQYVDAVTEALIDGLDSTGDTDTQLVFFENSTSTMGGNGRHDRWAIVNSVFDLEDNASPPSNPLTQFTRTCYGPVIRNNTFLGQKTLFRDAVGEEFVPIGGAIQGNIFHENSGQVLEDQVAGDIDNNHYIGGTATAWDRNATSGGTVADVIADRANNDYRIVSGSDVDDRSGDYYEGDLYGVARTGGIGAAEAGTVAVDGTPQVNADGSVSIIYQRPSGLFGSTITRDTGLTLTGSQGAVARTFSFQSVSGAGTGTLRAEYNPIPPFQSVANGTVTFNAPAGLFTDENGVTTAEVTGINDGDNGSEVEPAPSTSNRRRLTGGSAATFRVRIT